MTALVMDSPGRLAHARRDRDRAGSGGKRARDSEAKAVDPDDDAAVLDVEAK
ncbi:MAG: hypothetical protein ABR878_11270 [Roseiarcus sp.]